LVTKIIKTKKTLIENLGKVYLLIAPSSSNENVYLAHELRPNKKPRIIALDLTKVMKENL